MIPKEDYLVDTINYGTVILAHVGEVDQRVTRMLSVRSHKMGPQYLLDSTYGVRTEFKCVSLSQFFAVKYTFKRLFQSGLEL